MKATNIFNRLILFTLILGLVGTGCASLTKTEKGTAAGAATGAVIGGAIGKAKGNTAKGAVLGAVIGGTAGAIIGHRMDQQAKELEEQLEDAEVERVGEGIIITFDSGILFDFDSSVLRPEARQNLMTFAQNLEQYDGTEVMIVGHTDAVGSESYNQLLSERRANAAASYLMQQGVRPRRLTQTGRGESEPVADNDTEYGRQQNRRVEIAIFADEAQQNALSSD